MTGSKHVLTVSSVLSALALVLMLGACSSKKEKPNKYDNATTANDLFPVEQGMPMREVKKNQEFFFKKCEQVNSSRPYFTKTEYECSEVR